MAQIFNYKIAGFAWNKCADDGNCKLKKYQNKCASILQLKSTKQIEIEIMESGSNPNKAVAEEMIFHENKLEKSKIAAL